MDRIIIRWIACSDCEELKEANLRWRKAALALTAATEAYKLRLLAAIGGEP